MSIELVTPKQRIREYIQERVREMESGMIEDLQLIGEDCIAQARKHHGYKDQTGNLSSSIGYGIVKNGRVVYRSSFEQVKDGEDGVKSGGAFLDDIARELGEKGGYTLIVVAGRKYAVYVQYGKNGAGRDVLGGAELVAKGLFDDLKEELQKK